MARESWLDLLLTQAGVAELDAHRRALEAAGHGGRRTVADARAAVEISLLLQERRQRAVELAALNDVAGRLATVVDPSDLLGEVVEQARRLLGVDLTYVALLQEDTLRIEVASGDRSPHLVGTRLPRQAGLVGSVVEAGAPRWTSDYATDSELVHEPGADRAAASESIRGLLGVPLAVRGRILGVLLAAKREERRFARHEIDLLSALAAHAAVAIDNARTSSELRVAKADLETTLRLDAEITRAVMGGGDPASMVERVPAMARAGVRWVEHPGDGPVGDALGGLVGVDSPRRRDVGRFVVQPVAAAGELFGAFCVEVDDGDEVAPDVLLLVERAAPLVALTLVGARATARAVQLGRDVATIDLLSRAEADADAERRRWRGAGLDPRRAHVVVVVAGDSVGARRFVAGLALGDRVATAVHRDHLVLVVPDDLDLSSRWRGGDAPAAGVSAPSRTPDGLRAAHDEARRTALAVDALGRRGVLARADELGVFALLLSRTGRRELHDQVVRELGPLLADDIPGATPLLETLEAFLDQGRRPRATATALHVHVNTVYQRLAALDRRLGEGWRDRALELQVLLRLRRAAIDLDAED